MSAVNIRNSTPQDYDVPSSAAYDSLYHIIINDEENEPLTNDRMANQSSAHFSCNSSLQTIAEHSESAQHSLSSTQSFKTRITNSKRSFTDTPFSPKSSTAADINDYQTVFNMDGQDEIMSQYTTDNSIAVDFTLRKQPKKPLFAYPSIIYNIEPLTKNTNAYLYHIHLNPDPYEKQFGILTPQPMSEELPHLIFQAHYPNYYCRQQIPQHVINDSLLSKSSTIHSLHESTTQPQPITSEISIVSLNNSPCISIPDQQWSLLCKFNHLFFNQMMKLQTESDDSSNYLFVPLQMKSTSIDWIFIRIFIKYYSSINHKSLSNVNVFSLLDLSTHLKFESNAKINLPLENIIIQDLCTHAYYTFFHQKYQPLMRNVEHWKENKLQNSIVIDLKHTQVMEDEEDFMEFHPRNLSGSTANVNDSSSPSDSFEMTSNPIFKQQKSDLRSVKNKNLSILFLDKNADISPLSSSETSNTCTSSIDTLDTVHIHRSRHSNSICSSSTTTTTDSDTISTYDENNKENMDINHSKNMDLPLIIHQCSLPSLPSSKSGGTVEYSEDMDDSPVVYDMKYKKQSKHELSFELDLEPEIKEEKEMDLKVEILDELLSNIDMDVKNNNILYVWKFHSLSDFVQNVKKEKNGRIIEPIMDVIDVKDIGFHGKTNNNLYCIQVPFKSQTLYSMLRMPYILNEFKRLMNMLKFQNSSAFYAQCFPNVPLPIINKIFFQQKQAFPPMPKLLKKVGYQFLHLIFSCSATFKTLLSNDTLLLQNMSQIANESAFSFRKQLIDSQIFKYLVPYSTKDQYLNRLLYPLLPCATNTNHNISLFNIIYDAISHIWFYNRNMSHFTQLLTNIHLRILSWMKISAILKPELSQISMFVKKLDIDSCSTINDSKVLSNVHQLIDILEYDFRFLSLIHTCITTADNMIQYSPLNFDILCNVGYIICNAMTIISLAAKCYQQYFQDIRVSENMSAVENDIMIKFHQCKNYLTSNEYLSKQCQMHNLHTFVCHLSNENVSEIETVDEMNADFMFALIGAIFVDSNLYKMVGKLQDDGHGECMVNDAVLQFMKHFMPGNIAISMSLDDILEHRAYYSSSSAIIAREESDVKCNQSFLPVPAFAFDDSSAVNFAPKTVSFFQRKKKYEVGKKLENSDNYCHKKLKHSRSKTLSTKKSFDNCRRLVDLQCLLDETQQREQMDFLCAVPNVANTSKYNVGRRRKKRRQLSVPFIAKF